MMPLYVKNINNNIVVLYGNRESFRCRQRNRNLDGTKVEPLKFISYKGMLKEEKKWNKKIYNNFNYNTISKL